MHKNLWPDLKPRKDLTSRFFLYKKKLLLLVKSLSPWCEGLGMVELRMHEPSMSRFLGRSCCCTTAFSFVFISERSGVGGTRYMWPMPGLAFSDQGERGGT